jgi:hypothetical protein
MLRRNVLAAAGMALVLLVLASSACSKSSTASTRSSTTPPPGEVSLGREFTLSVGQNATVAGEDLGIKFVEVVSDSRCPQGVTCIWAGEVSCLVEVAKGSAGTSRIVLTQSGADGQTFRPFLDGYETMFRVEPYPVAGKQIARNEYRLVMTVTKSALSNMEVLPAPIREVEEA